MNSINNMNFLFSDVGILEYNGNDKTVNLLFVKSAENLFRKLRGW